MMYELWCKVISWRVLEVSNNKHQGSMICDIYKYPTWCYRYNFQWTWFGQYCCVEISSCSQVMSDFISMLYIVWFEEKKNINRDSILNLTRSTRKVMKLLSVDESIIIYFSFHHNIWYTLVVHIGSGMAAQQPFLKSISNLSSSKFWVVIQYNTMQWG